MPSSAESFLQRFLESVSPRRGIGYLLRKHYTGAYFPVFCMYDQRPVAFPQAFTPYAIDIRLNFERVLGRDLGILELASAARLEALFLEPPVKQNVFLPKGAEQDPPVLLVASLPAGSDFSIRARADDFAAAAVSF